MILAYRWRGATVSVLSVWGRNGVDAGSGMKTVANTPMRAATRDAYAAEFLDKRVPPPDALSCDARYAAGVDALVKCEDIVVRGRAADRDFKSLLSELKLAEALWPMALILAVSDAWYDGVIGYNIGSDTKTWLPEWKEPPLCVHGNRLIEGQSLVSAANVALLSSNGRFRLQQSESGLALYRGSTQLWSNNAQETSRKIQRTVMQPDGDLVSYADDGDAVWSSRTDGCLGACLVLGDDGQLAIHRGLGEEGSGADVIWRAELQQ
eukprot:TRINITY_DN7325_c0_g1_i2.p1 TRINITY_DN7325_c0_g1~~TRINITY_DN7325_c0_g1_i2.p1  ORF type:complete len:265 (+),score=58.03 TRINITY_DN7325_c0_g1_i2:191-985(+)